MDINTSIKGLMCCNMRRGVYGNGVHGGGVGLQGGNYGGGRDCGGRGVASGTTQDCNFCLRVLSKNVDSCKC